MVHGIGKSVLSWLMITMDTPMKNNLLHIIFGMATFMIVIQISSSSTIFGGLGDVEEQLMDTMEEGTENHLAYHSRSYGYVPVREFSYFSSFCCDV